MQEPQFTPTTATAVLDAPPLDLERASTGSMIVFDAVTKVYDPDVVALRDVTFHIDKGAFVNHPPLLVCDEPTGNLDPDTSVGIMQLLYRINRSGTTILMVTHDREMVDKMRKRVIQLEEGRLARDERRGGYTGE